MIEKEKIRELAEKKIKEAVIGFEDDLLTVEELKDQSAREKSANNLRATLARRIINILYGKDGDKSFINAWNDENNRKLIGAIISKLLIEAYPVLKTEGIVAYLSTQIIDQLAGDEVEVGKPEQKKPEPVVVKYETLTPEEIASLPEEAREELKPFLALHNLLIGYDNAKSDEVDAIRELIEESLGKAPKADIIKFLMGLKFNLGGLGNVDEAKLKKFLKGVVENAKAILSEKNSTAIDEEEKDEKIPDFGGEVGEGHRDLDGWISFYGSEFAKRYEYKPDLGVDYLLSQAALVTKGFYSSLSGITGGAFTKLLAVYKVLNQFGKSSAARDAAPIPAGKESIYFFEAESDQEKRNFYIDTLRRKATELLNLAYLEDVALKMGNDNSMTSDWAKIAEYATNKPKEFNEGTFDSMLHPEREKRLERYSYKYADVLRWAMWEMPHWVREFTYIDGFSDRDPKTRDRFDKFAESRILAMLKQASNSTKTVEVDGEVMKITSESAKDLLLSSSGENSDFFIFNKILQSMSTVLGVRMHTFRIDLARGATPSGGVNDQKRWISTVSPYALFNYKCYKELTPHLTIEGFNVKLGAPIKTVDETQSLDEKLANMNGSLALTKYVLRAVSELRTPIELGDLSQPPLRKAYIALDNYEEIDPNDVARVKESGREVVVAKIPKTPDLGKIDNIYPDFYSFIVRNYKKRSSSGKEAAGLLGWWGNMEPIEKFVQQALGQPLNTSDKDKISQMKPEAARKEMIENLKKLIHTVVSSIKANEAWVRWDHVAQFILIYIDKMYRDYRLVDISPGGSALFTRAIRITIDTSMSNLSGLGENDDNLKALAIKSGTDEKEKNAYATNSGGGFKNRMPSILSASDYSFENGSIPESVNQRPWGLRDYLLNRIARATGNSLSPHLMLLNYSYYDYFYGLDGSIKRAEPASRGGFDGLLRRGEHALKVEISKIRDKNQLEGFYKSAENILFGTPTEDQKKTVDDKK